MSSDALVTLSNLLLQSPEDLDVHSQDISKASRDALKYVFDRALSSETLAASHINNLIEDLNPSKAVITRSKARKPLADQKIELAVPLHKFSLTPLNELFVDGMDSQQLWGQIELRTDAFCKTLHSIVQPVPQPTDDDFARIIRMRNGYVDSPSVTGEIANEEEVEESTSEETVEDDDLMDVFDSEGSQSSHGHSDSLEELDDALEAELNPRGLNEHAVDLNDTNSDADGTSSSGTPRPNKRTGRHSSRTFHPELDDNFFSIKEFNAETVASEAQTRSTGRLDSSDDEEEDEPVDFFSSHYAEETVFEEDDLEDQNTQPFYSEFFDPPTKSKLDGKRKPSTSSKVPSASGKVKFHNKVRVKEFGEDTDDSFPTKKLKATRENVVQIADDDSEATDDGELSPDSFRDDLLGDDESDNNEEATKSSHEKRVEAIGRQISQLEQENVDEKCWTLMGEANSRKRPRNSLLEEDLDFEQVQRPVQIITQESVTSLEDMIKKRILETTFDDVQRKRPLDDKAFLPSRALQLDDSKSKQSLAGIYEQEFIDSKDGDALPATNSKLQLEHTNLEAMWEGIAVKLDALCNTHFTPKAPKASIKTIANVATATIESALPTSKGTGTVMAPEEIFTPLPRDTRARSELTPSEKRIQRAKERKQRQKTRDKINRVASNSSLSRGRRKSDSQKDAKGVIKSKRGVTVVGQKRTKHTESNNGEVGNASVLKL